MKEKIDKTNDYSHTLFFNLRRKLGKPSDMKMRIESCWFLTDTLYIEYGYNTIQ